MHLNRTARCYSSFCIRRALVVNKAVLHRLLLSLSLSLTFTIYHINIDATLTTEILIKSFICIFLLLVIARIYIGLLCTIIFRVLFLC